MLTITVDVSAGSNLDKTLEEAKTLALRMGITVEFDFNDTNYLVFPSQNFYKYRRDESYLTVN